MSSIDLARCLLPILIAAAASPSNAIDYVVTRYDDPFPDGCQPGDCSLREATLEANASVGADRVLLSSGTYPLTRFGLDDTGQLGDLDLLDDIEIVGPAARLTRIDAAPLGTTLAEPVIDIHSGDTTLRGLTVANGVSDGVVVIAPATLLIESCEVRENDFQGSSAGVAAFGGSTVTIRNSAIINNGRGVQTSSSQAVLENVTLTSNDRGDIVVSGHPGLRCSHCTLVGTAGGFADVLVHQSIVNFENSIVVGNCSAELPALIISAGGNLESPGHDCNFSQSTDLEDVSVPGLAVLGEYGGPTRTLDVLATSLARGHGVEDSCLDVDQRGVARIGSGSCDAGAVEFIAPGPPIPLFADGFEQGSSAAWATTIGS